MSLAEPASPYPSGRALREATCVAITLLAGARTSPRLGGSSNPRFEPWSLSKDEGLRASVASGGTPRSDLVPGNICWLDNTPAGDEVARRIEAARDT